MGMRSKGSETVKNAIAERRMFRQASMHGQSYPDGSAVPTGILPQESRLVLAAIDRPVYVVFSYRTPIGWHDGNTWTIPAHHYSVTTTNHQTLTRVGADRSEVEQ